jgi:chromosomal replication initiation ATPase DnaA
MPKRTGYQLAGDILEEAQRNRQPLKEIRRRLAAESGLSHSEISDFLAERYKPPVERAKEAIQRVVASSGLTVKAQQDLFSGGRSRTVVEIRRLAISAASSESGLPMMQISQMVGLSANTRQR